MGKRDDALTTEALVMTMIVVAVAMFAGSLASAVDTWVMGHFLTEDDISASGLVVPFIGIIAVTATIFGNGSQLLLSESIAKGDRDKSAQIFTTSVFTVFSITAVASALLFIFAPQLCIALGMTGGYSSLLDNGVDYCRGYAIGLPFFGVAISVNQTLQLDGDRTLGLIAVLVANVFNIASDIISVVIFHKGIFALAFCTSLGNIIMFLIIMLHYRPGRHNILILRPASFRLRENLAIFARGIPNAILIASEMVKGIILNYVLLAISDEEHVAAVSVMSSTNILESAILSGFFGAISVICGAVAGEGDTKGLRRVMYRSYKIGLGVSAGLVAFAMIFAGILPRIFVHGEAIISIAATAIRIMVLAIPFRIASGVICGMYLGMKYEGLSTIIHIFRDLIIPGACFVIFGRAFGVTGVWISVIFAYALSLVLIIAFALIRMRNKNVSFSNKILLIDHEKADYDSYEATMRTMEDVAQISEDLRQYCLKENLSEKTAFVTALAVEEMCHNALIHNNPDGRKHCMEIKFNRKDEEDWYLRIRDDYKLFDPCEWLKAHEEGIGEDGATRIGIKMIHDMTKEIIYTQLLQMNNLILVIGDEK